MIIHSDTWPQHLQWVAAVLKSLIHCQSEEVCNCSEEGTVYGLPLGRPKNASVSRYGRIRLLQVVYPHLRGTDQPFDGRHAKKCLGSSPVDRLALLRVKKALCEPLLLTPNIELIEEVDGLDQPVLYFSQKLAERGERYSRKQIEGVHHH